MNARPVRSKLVSELTPNEYRACTRLSMRNRGSMYPRLQKLYHGQDYASRFDNGVPAQVFMIWDADDDERLLGWALLFTDWYGKLMSYYYVRQSCRRQGLGTKLARALRTHCQQAQGVSWNDISKQFHKHVDTHVVAS